MGATCWDIMGPSYCFTSMKLSKNEVLITFATSMRPKLKRTTTYSKKKEKRKNKLAKFDPSFGVLNLQNL